VITIRTTMLGAIAVAAVMIPFYVGIGEWISVDLEE
jgi:hypothetical protein